MKVYARVGRVLVGDSDLGFVHAVAEDGAEFKLELASAYAKRIQRNDVLSINIEVERIPAPLSARTFASRVPPSRLVPNPRSEHAPRETLDRPQTSANGEGPPPTSREVPTDPRSSVTADAEPTARRSASSPDPRKRRRTPDRELRRLLGLAKPRG